MTQSDPTPTSGAYPALTVLLGLITTAITGVLTQLNSGDRLAQSMLIPFALGTILGAILLLPLLAAGLSRLIAKPFTPRKGWKAAFVGMLLTLLMQGAEFARVGAKIAQGDPEAMAIATSDSNWERYESAGWGFSADFPGTPALAVSEDAVTVTLIKPNAGFLIALSARTPEEDATEVYDHVGRAFMESFQRAENQTRALFHHDVIGREVMLTNLPENQEMLLWMFLKDDILYRISLNGPAAPLDADIATRFVSSFSITPADGSELSQR